MASRGTAIYVFYRAITIATGVPLDGDVGNHTIKICADGDATPNTPTNSPSAVDATNMPGWYKLLLTAGECTCDSLLVTGKSGAGVRIDATPLTFELLPTVLSASGWVKSDLQTILDDTDAVTGVHALGVAYYNAGAIDANVIQWAGGSVFYDVAGYPITTIKIGTGTGELSITSGVVKANLAQILGTALTETAGLIAAGFKNFFNIASPTGTVNSLPAAIPAAAGGLYTRGTGAGQINQDANGRIDANIVAVGGTTASTSTIVDANVTQISGDSTAADNAELFFDGTGYAGTNNVIPTVTAVTGLAANAIAAASIATGAITSAKFASGAITADAIATDAIGASELAASAVTEIQSGLATGTAPTVAEIIAAMAGVVNPTIYAAGTGSTLDLYRGDSYANADSRGIVITETANESHWPTTLSNVYFWAKPTAALVSVDADAEGVPPILTVSTLTSVTTTATCTTTTVHGLSTGDVVLIYGAAQPQYNKYASITVTSTTAFTYTITSGATTPATGTITVQAGIACTVTSATGSAQAFRFEPTAAQLRRASADGRGNGYTFWFIANPATAPAVLRSGEWNVRPDPGM